MKRIYFVSVYFVSVLFLLAALPARADDDKAAAREHTRRGARAYDLGHYRDAVTEFEAAYQAKDDPALLFNIGQAYRAAGDYANAITAYKSFIRNLPHTDRRRDIEARIAELERVLAAQARASSGPPEGTLPAPPHAHVEPAPPPVEFGPAPPPVAMVPSLPSPAPSTESARADHPGRVKLFSGIGVAVVGVGGIVAGAVFAALAKSADQEFLHPSNGVYSSTADDHRTTYPKAEVACFATGGVALVGGAVLVALGVRESKRARLTASVGPGHASAAVAFSF